MTSFDQLLIGGEWVAPSTDRRFEVRSPATLEVVGSVPEAVEADVDAAVAAAPSRLRPRAVATTSPVGARQGHRPLHRAADRAAGRLQGRSHPRDGRPRRDRRDDDVHAGDGCARRLHRSSPTTFPWEETRNGLFGVRASYAASRSAWSPRSSRGTFRCSSRSTSSIPALLAGCTVVLKPAPETPIDALMLGGLFVEAGCPRASSPCCRPIARSASTSSRIPASTRSRSPARRPAGRGRRRWRPSGSSGSRWSSAASRPQSCSTTSTWRRARS